jgi:hypothetical protein
MSKTAKVVLAAVSSLALAVVLLASYGRRPQPSRLELREFMGSVQKVAEARRERGQPSLGSVSVPALVEGGHITDAQAKLFKGAEVTFRDHSSDGPASLELAATHVLFSVKLRDGREAQMTADGSIHLHQSRVAFGP